MEKILKGHIGRVTAGKKAAKKKKKNVAADMQ